MKRCLFLLIFFFVNANSFAQSSLVRGPYLQVVTPTGIIIRWRTAAREDAQVNFGTSADKLLSSATNALPDSEHVVQLNNLLPNTKYFYSIGSTRRVLQGDVNNFFFTAPTVGSIQKIRFLALGDCGFLTTNQIATRDQFLKYSQDKPFNLTLLLGDNAYVYGKDDEFQAGFFDTYEDGLLKKSVLMPATGNHDYGNNPDLQVSHQIDYFNIFTLPQNAEAGGVPSGTEAYYSYDYGNIHFIALDSYGIENGNQRMYDTLSPQVIWLKKDLAATKQAWKIVYWHHPPYTKGSYDSDLVEELYLTRRNLLRILEDKGVDLVLCGHSHTYERSTLLRNHYGNSDTYRQKFHSMSRTNSSARYDSTANSCPFVKTQRGTVYVVAGTGALVIPGRKQDSAPHKAMVYSNFDYHGSLIVEVEDNRLDAKWLCEDGVIRDQFTLMKNVNQQTDITANYGVSLKLTASFSSNYVWQDGSTNRVFTTQNLTNSTTFYVNDKQKCLVDSFRVTVLPRLSLNVLAFPNPAADNLNINYEIPETGNYQMQLLDFQGNILREIPEEFYEKGSFQKTISLPEKLPADKTIFLKIQSDKIQTTKKVMIVR